MLTIFLLSAVILTIIESVEWVSSGSSAISTGDQPQLSAGESSTEYQQGFNEGYEKGFDAGFETGSGPENRIT